MVTHTLYDFLAFGFILIAWPVETKDEENKQKREETR